MSAERYGQNNTSFTQLVQRLVGFPEDQVEKVFTAAVASEYGLCPTKMQALKKQSVGGVMPNSTLAGVWDARTYKTTNLNSPRHVFTPVRENPLISRLGGNQPSTSSYYDKYLKGSNNKIDN